jgi:hypothetical protein
LLAVDVAEVALEQARIRCANHPEVTLRRLCIPHEWPTGKFDLIIFSEVLYFLSLSDIRLTAQKAVASLTSQGRIVLVNWAGDTGHPLSGEAAVNIFHDAAAPGVVLQCREWRPGYRLDIYRCTS